METKGNARNVHMARSSTQQGLGVVRKGHSQRTTSMGCAFSRHPLVWRGVGRCDLMAFQVLSKATLVKEKHKLRGQPQSSSTLKQEAREPTVIARTTRRAEVIPIVPIVLLRGVAIAHRVNCNAPPPTHAPANVRNTQLLLRQTSIQ